MIQATVLYGHPDNPDAFEVYFATKDVPLVERLVGPVVKSHLHIQVQAEPCWLQATLLQSCHAGGEVRAANMGFMFTSEVGTVI